MAPLQKRALYSLAAGVVLAAAVVVVLVIQGDVPAFFNDLNSRLVLYAAVIGVPLIYLILVNISLRKPTQLDERDRLVIDKSRTVQWFFIILSLAAWNIGLTEVYSDTRTCRRSPGLPGLRRAAFLLPWLQSHRCNSLCRSDQF